VFHTSKHPGHRPFFPLRASQCVLQPILLASYNLIAPPDAADRALRLIGGIDATVRY
jgi:hypothetical protein